MQGQSDTLTSAEVVADCYEYKFLANEMVPLKNPVGEDITFDRMQSYRYEQGTNLIDWLNAHITGSSCYGHTNLVPEFCRAYNKITGNQES